MAWTAKKTQFAADILHGIGAPVTAGNLALMLAWQRSEGGSARFNPFNTTLSRPGAGSYNSVGVRNYTSYQQGLNATIATLRNGYYGGILSSLKHGGNPYQTAAAIGKSPWGSSGSLIASVLHGMGGFPHPPAQQQQGPRYSPIQRVIRFSRRQIGEPYVWGGTGPNGWDCSGIVYQAYLHAGYKGIGRTTYQQIKQGVAVSRNNLHPGDIVFPSAHHEGLYVGNGMVLEAPHTGDHVKIIPLSSFGFMTARRLAGGGGGIVAPKGIKGLSPSGLPVAGSGVSPAQIAALAQQQNAALMQGAQAQAKMWLHTFKPPQLTNSLEGQAVSPANANGGVDFAAQNAADLSTTLDDIRTRAWSHAGLGSRVGGLGGAVQ